ncbi:MAG: signal peptidase II [Actinomycetota bacterium]
MALARTDGSRSLGKLVIAVVVVLDQATKHWALNELASGRTIDLVWTLRFNLVFNSGMAFSRGQGSGRIIGLLAIGVTVWLWRGLSRQHSKLAIFGTALLIGGALGNVVDRLFRGEAWLGGSVVDFIDLQWFPVFNIADSAVSVGALLVVSSLYSTHRRSKSIQP